MPDVSANKGRTNNEDKDPNAAARDAPEAPNSAAHGTGGLPEGPGRTLVGEPPSPSATASSLADGPASSRGVVNTNTKAEFQPLFNGKDSTGWVTRPGQSGHWRVENGILVGSGAE